MPLDITHVAVCSANHLSLKKRFQDSYQDDFPLHFIPFDDKGSGRGDCGTHSWHHALRKKAEATLEWVTKLEGKFLIFSDVDIQFFGKARPVVEEMFGDPELDIVFQAEYRLKKFRRGCYNTGFVGIRCSQKVAQFYSRMVEADLSKLELGDQTWTNNHIEKSGLVHRAFPPSIWATSQGMPLPDDIVLHHANCTRGKNAVRRKHSHMNRVQSMVAQR